MGDWCPIGPLSLHTWNYEHTECIWCGENALAWKPGCWVSTGSGHSAWKAYAKEMKPAMKPKEKQDEQ
jgi:hypothetical protein